MLWKSTCVMKERYGTVKGVSSDIEIAGLGMIGRHGERKVCLYETGLRKSSDTVSTNLLQMRKNVCQSLPGREWLPLVHYQIDNILQPGRTAFWVRGNDDVIRLSGTLQRRSKPFRWKTHRHAQRTLLVIAWFSTHELTLPATPLPRFASGGNTTARTYEYI